MNSFRIIAIKPLVKCYSKHLKVLKKNTIYYFYQDYSINHLRVKNETISYNKSYPSNLFNKGGLSINISAVVGGNGSGKSTIVELLFKAINNIAYKFKRKEGDKDKTITSDIEEVKGVHLDFYFEKDNRIFKVNVLDAEFNVFEFIGTDSNKILNNEPLKNFNLSKLFYTEVINYSHYAYNSKHEGNWIQSLFHKNDSYQTPVVFNPMRTDGNTDINVENELVKQRLIANLLYPPLSKNENDFRKIGENLIGFEIRLKLKPEKTKVLHKPKSNETFDINNTIKPKQRSAILYKIYEIFYGIKNFKRIGALIDKNVYNRIESYIVYKLISITYKYEEYIKYFNRSNKDFNYDIINDFFIDLKEDDSHITFKLKQTLNYLHYGHIPYKKNNPIKLNTLSNVIEKIIKQNKKNRIIELIPPPIFDLEIILKNNENENIEFTLLSSGEKQFIYSVNSLLYHLRNLDSVSDNKVQYKNINIVFEEIELYFHPNLQRKFINELLKSIERTKLVNITSINIIFITHSPFILSDIPSKNVMFLKVKNGRTIQNFKKRNTFGANIHELLSSNFFFQEEIYIGEFAKNVIENIINEINDSEDVKLSENRIGYLNKFVSLIDDKIIRIKLREMLYEVSDVKKDKISWIDAEIEYLKDLKKQEST